MELSLYAGTMPSYVQTDRFEMETMKRLNKLVPAYVTNRCMTR
jgi:hypothetical protein